MGPPDVVGVQLLSLLVSKISCKGCWEYCISNPQYMVVNTDFQNQRCMWRNGNEAEKHH